jgi:hypothetical protein
MRWARLEAENHRGVRVPRVLGLALALGAAGSTLSAEAVGEVRAAGWGALAGTLLVGAAGVVDDLAPPGPRGLRGHLRALAGGRVSTGILKLVVIVGSALFAVALQPRRTAGVELAGAILVAGCANLWNGLDVRPGRALKAFLVVAAVVVATADLALAPSTVGLLVAGALVLPLDLRERAMLGDAGANLLGFAAGLGLYGALGDAGVLGVSALAVALNVLAETVTLSRAIEATPPLRWVDRLGRLP